MNATSLYVSTCRLILQAKVEDSTSWLDLYKLFPCLRQSLSCTVCGSLLLEPYTPTESQCQHHVCRSCKGGKKKLKPSCSWCKDYGKYVENVQLRTLLQCYKKLCQYVASSELYRALSTHTNPEQLLDIIKEGSGFRDDFKTSTPLFMLPATSCTSFTSTSTQTSEEPPAPVLNGVSSPVYSVYSSVGNRLTLKRTATESEDSSNTNGEPNDNSFKGTGRSSKVRKRMSLSMTSRCECGGGVTSSVRSTCRGYRCPCYSVDRPCLHCSCTGCNNPIGPNKSQDQDDSGSNYQSEKESSNNERSSDTACETSS